MNGDYPDNNNERPKEFDDLREKYVIHMARVLPTIGFRDIEFLNYDDDKEDKWADFVAISKNGEKICFKCCYSFEPVTVETVQRFVQAKAKFHCGTGYIITNNVLEKRAADLAKKHWIFFKEKFDYKEDEIIENEENFEYKEDEIIEIPQDSINSDPIEVVITLPERPQRKSYIKNGVLFIFLVVMFFVLTVLCSVNDLFILLWAGYIILLLCWTLYKLSKLIVFIVNVVCDGFKSGFSGSSSKFKFQYTTIESQLKGICAHKRRVSYFRGSTGEDYEQYVMREMRAYEFKHVRGTATTGDYGADIFAEGIGGVKICVQCKKYSQPVGIKAVQEIVSAKQYYNQDVAMVISNNTYTKAAKNLAASCNVILVEYFK